MPTTARHCLRTFVGTCKEHEDNYFDDYFGSFVFYNASASMGVILQILNWIRDEWHRVVIFLLAMDHLYDRLQPMFEKLKNTEEYVEKRFHQRRHEMLNPITIVTDINLAVTAITKVQAALPQIQKTVADIKQAVADKQDTTKLDADLVTLMADVQTDLEDISNLFPTAPVSTPVMVPQATVPTPPAA